MSKLLAINENRIFRRVYQKGKSYVHPILVTYIRKARGGQVHVGITASKKIGNAVKRNRARRVIREAYRQLYQKVKPGYEIVFVARAKTPFVKSTAIYEIMKKHFDAAGVLNEKNTSDSHSVLR